MGIITENHTQSKRRAVEAQSQMTQGSRITEEEGEERARGTQQSLLTECFLKNLELHP